MRTAFVCAIPWLLVSVLIMLCTQSARAISDPEPLPDMGVAPPFALSTQNNQQFDLNDLRGKVAVVNFVFTRCAHTCPMLVVKLLTIQSDLADHFGRDVHFVSVTLDAEYDKPEVLKRWAIRVGADINGWSFLTGTPQQVAEVVNSYGVVYSKQGSEASIEHNQLTSIIDRNGILRVQYMGDRFDNAEFLQDIHSLITESDPLK